VDHNSLAAHITKVILKGVKKCRISSAMDETGDDIAHLPQQCHYSKFFIFEEKLLKVLKCYNFL
jgi:hypothetical protein